MSRLRVRRGFAVCLIGCMGLPAAHAAPTAQPACTDPTKADADFPFQGEYVGEIPIDGQPMRVGLQVIARGNAAFDVVAFPGGLPGDGWQAPMKEMAQGTRVGEGADAVVKVDGVDSSGTRRRGVIRQGKADVLADDGAVVATLAKVERTSPTLGAAPPEGAIVLVDGAGPVDERQTLVTPRLTDDGLVMEGMTTRQSFGDARWHIEFRLPYMPEASGQARGNSGAYVMGVYEVQMLDSFGLEGRDNECGGVYSVKPPAVNMCLPPLAWQTYDIDVTAPRFEGGRKVTNARMTVRHNGVVIHDDIEIAKVTPGGVRGEEGPTGPLFLQDHGNPVRYRSIWVLPGTSQALSPDAAR
ncbi:MAG: DUF1080 domain-containing protein [Planctomycetaceae bacterium]